MSKVFTRSDLLFYLGSVIDSFKDFKHSCITCIYHEQEGSYWESIPYYSICTHDDEKISKMSNLKSFPFKKEMPCYRCGSERDGWTILWEIMHIHGSEEKDKPYKWFCRLCRGRGKHGLPRLNQRNIDKCLHEYNKGK